MKTGKRQRTENPLTTVYCTFARRRRVAPAWNAERAHNRYESRVWAGRALVHSEPLITYPLTIHAK